MILNSPIILFCSERSGSNLISKIFDTHPEICGPGACHLFKILSECAYSYPPGSSALKEAVCQLFDTKVSHWAIDNWSADKRQAHLADLQFANEMAAELYAAETIENGKRYTLIKENSAFEYLSMLLSVSQKPRILFMVRDPRDMAVSWINGPVMRGGAVRAAERWHYDQQGYLRTLSQLGGNVRSSFLRYEDLLAAPQDELTRVCDDLSLDFHEAMIDFANQSESAQKDAKRSAMWDNLNKPLMVNNSNKFLKQLSDDQIAFIEAATAPFMTILGYKSVRQGKPKFAGREGLEALRSELLLTEPWDKKGYSDLPSEERRRFENWSRLTANMRGRPPLPFNELYP